MVLLGQGRWGVDVVSPDQEVNRRFELCRLLARLVRDRAQVVVWVGDEGRRQILDDYLWTFDPGAFLPHAMWNPNLGEMDDPVVLVGEEQNPNRAETLVVADGLPPGEWANSFRVVHDFIPPGEDGEERSLWWQRWREENPTLR